MFLAGFHSRKIHRMSVITHWDLSDFRDEDFRLWELSWGSNVLGNWCCFIGRDFEIEPLFVGRVIAYPERWRHWVKKCKVGWQPTDLTTRHTWLSPWHKTLSAHPLYPVDFIPLPGKHVAILVFTFTWDLGKRQPLWGLRSSFLLGTTSSPVWGSIVPEKEWSLQCQAALPLANCLAWVLLLNSVLQ